MPQRTFKVRPNTFFIENQVTNGQMIFDQHGDFSNATDDLYNMKTGANPNYLLLSGNIDSSESVKRGRYSLVGGFLRTYVSGMSIENGDGDAPSLRLYSLKPNYTVSEGSMKFGRQTAAGTVALVNASSTVTGTGTDFSGSTGVFKHFFDPLYNGLADVWLGPAGSRTKYRVASIASDTSLTLSSNYTGSSTTSQLQLDNDIGAGISTYTQAYSMPQVNFNEDFDGTDATLSNVTTFEREGANVVRRSGHPYVLNSQYANWSRLVYLQQDGENPVKVQTVKDLMAEVSYYPMAAQNNYELKGPGGDGGYVSAATNADGSIRARFQAPEMMTEGMAQYGVPGLTTGRLYLTRLLGTMGTYWILDTMGQRTEYVIELYGTNKSLLYYDTNETFDPNPDNTVTTTNNNTIFDKVYSTMMFENPFTASTEVPIVASTVELQSDVVKSGANAARMYHLWDWSPDNSDIQKYFGRNNSINPQTAYMAKYNLPFPLTQDFSNTEKLGDRRTYLPYVSLDMNIAKLGPNVLFDIFNYNSQFHTAKFINDPTVTYTDAGIDSTFGTEAQRKRVETFLRSVVVTFSNYKPLDTHTTLEEFLQYGFDNAYGTSQSDESVVGGVVFNRYGMDGADIDNDFIYAQALPIVRSRNTHLISDWETGTYGMGLATFASGTAAGSLKTMGMRPTDLSNTVDNSTLSNNTPRVVKLPMNQFFNMKFYTDVFATQNDLINSRQPYANFPVSNQGVGMRCVFQTDTVNTDSSDEDLYTNMPYLDLNFSCSGGNASPGGSTGGSTPVFSFADNFVQADKIVHKYPKHMIIWVQNYRFVNSTETFFAFGDNAVIDTASGAAIEAEVFIDNVQGVDYWHNPSNASAVGKTPNPIGFPQGQVVNSPLTKLEDGTIDLTSLNPGKTQVEYTSCDTTLYEYTPASYWSIGFDNKEDLPLSGSSTGRNGFILMNDFYTSAFDSIDSLLPNLYSGATISLDSAAYAGGYFNTFAGFQLYGSPYASGTVGTNYYDAAVGNNQYSVTGGKDIVSKINIGTSTSNNFMSTDGFTQKGFVNLAMADAGNSSGDAYTEWGKRENPLCSTKVVEVANGNNELTKYQLRLHNTSLINALQLDAEYILYQVGMSFSDNFYRILTLASGLDSISAEGVVTFNEQVQTGSSGQRIGQETQLPALYFSPYKYWINLNTRGDTEYKPRSYTGMTLVNNNLSGATAAPLSGTTFNETNYTFSPTLTGNRGLSAKYEKPWSFVFDTEMETSVNLVTDYGYGAYNTATKDGGHVADTNTRLSTYNYMNITNYVTSAGVQEDGEFAMLMRPKPSSYETSVVLVGDEYSSTNSLQYKPTYIFEYQDLPPYIESFIVNPAINLLEEKTDLYSLTNENLNAVKFEYDIKDDDIWYKMILLDKNGDIENKYQNAKLWIPCNEAPLDSTVAPVTTWYKPNDNDASGSATVGANVRSFIDGIQGYSPLLSGNAVGTASIEIPLASAGGSDVFNGLTEYTLVAHVTFDSTMNGVACKILGQGQPVSNYVVLSKDANNNLTYRHESSTGTGVTITGTQVLKCDGATAYSIIVTYRYQSEAGPDLQLYVDGVRDAYETNSAGAVINTADKFELAVHSSGVPYFKGRIEEVIVYDKQYFVVDGGEYILNTADLPDLTSSKINTWAAKLFAFDYHNIRGKTYKNVAASQTVSWRTTTI